MKVGGENESEGGSSAPGQAEEGWGQPQDGMSRHRGAKASGEGRGEVLGLRRWGGVGELAVFKRHELTTATQRWGAVWAWRW